MDFPVNAANARDDAGPDRLQGPGNQECEPDLRDCPKRRA
jgi:hypothetical protein